jgi:threonine synthase
VSSNFERLLAELGGRDGAALAVQMAGFDQSRAMRLTEAQAGGAGALFGSDRVDADDMGEAMRWACAEAGQLLDPHTGIALAAARRAALPDDVPVVTLATAHPAKFPDAVERATGRRPALPAHLADLMDKPERFAVLPAAVGAVEGFVRERTRAGAGAVH